MPRIKLYVLLVAMFPMIFAQQAQAARGEGSTTAKQGVVRCGGNHFLRLGGSESHTATYVIRNFDAINPIVINRLRFFDATGAILFDSTSGGLPPSDNGILGPTNNTLTANQSVFYQTEDILPFLAPANRPIQLEIEWSSAQKALTLDAITVRIVRQRDPVTGAMQAERSRHAVECRSILLN